ncbi:protein kinase family protein [Streptomyces zaomyceticus]|uniref:protein kinase family protein n=1 Tax=Streptomyces zaomyceticus TaxID=68286 RepID=UPI00167956FF|nr:protein kinase family protein [Streptomyces zaomyceticus]
MAKVLAESGAELSHEELLDALWLAGKLPPGTAPLARAVTPTADPAPSDIARDDAPSELAAPPVETAAPADGPGERPAPAAAVPHAASPLLAAARPYPYGDNPLGAESGADARPSRAVAVRAPDSRLIEAGQLRLGKSLRPLRRRYPDRARHELDIARTVAAIADSGLPEIVARPARTRWLSLALVVDDGVSMVLWHRLAAEIRTLMERAGAFRDVRVYGLHTRAGGPYLRPGPYRPHGRPRSTDTLSDPTGHTLVLVVSDGVGEAWRDGGMRRAMERWARCGPTAIVHALPAHLWASTGIGAQRWQVTSHHRGGPTHAWHVTDPDLPPGLVDFDSVPVPVLAPTPAAVADWARLVASGGTALLPLWNGGRPHAGRSATAEAHTHTGARRGDEAEAVLRFRDAATPEAYRLAAHLAAVSPVTPPVMRLVQSALGPPTDAGHLMEVFLGGLMHQLAADAPDLLPHHRRFDFTSDARRVLLGAVSPRELLRTTEAVTARVEAAVGRAPVFPAWVGHPDGTAVIYDTGRSFGWLREQLLGRLGVPVEGASRTPPPPPGELPAGWEALLPEDPPRLGRFRLTARSGRGWVHVTMYLGEDENGTAAVVRVPSPGDVGGRTPAGELVTTEADCLGRMQGRHAPELLDARVGHVSEPDWVAMARVHRRTDDPTSGPAPNLRFVLDEHEGVVPTERFLRIGRALAEAVDRAHMLGLVHGALGPRSVLVTDHDDVHLVSWMTAGVDGRESPHRGLFPVREAYLAEGGEGLLPTAESDVYALGAVLLSLLMGSWEDPRVGDGQHRPPATTGIGPVLLGTLWNCLNRRPGRRPTAGELAIVFAEELAGPDAGTSRGEALAVFIRQSRDLARDEPEVYGHVLGQVLRLRANSDGSDRSVEAIADLLEAVNVYREVGSWDPETHNPGLAMSLNNLSVKLREAGRRDESLAAASEAETLFRSLQVEDAPWLERGHAMTLNNLSNVLAELGRHEEALAAIEVAVELHRRLLAADQFSRGDGLAMCLTNLGNRLGALGRPEEALLAAEESVHLYRPLYGDQVEHAVSLNNLAVRFIDLERYGEAAEALNESAQVVADRIVDPSEASRAVLEQSRRIKALLDTLAQGRRHDL